MKKVDIAAFFPYISRTMAASEKQKLFLIDGYALAYRSHFAFINNPLINSRGENTSAIFGFTRTLLHIVDTEQPHYLGVVFDTPEPTFRHQAYAAYKATRERMPDDMRDQLPRLRAVIEALQIPILEIPGYEADDVLATLAKKAAAAGMACYLVTSDKDLMQIVSDSIKIYNLRRQGDGVDIIDPAGVMEKFGVAPGQIVDYLALVGDSSDNVPGVPKVGKKTAVQLLGQFRSLDDIFAHLEQIKGNAVRESLKHNLEQARISQKLVTLDTAAPVELNLQSLRLGVADSEKATALFRDLEFTSLVNRFTRETPAEPAKYITIKNAAELESVLGEIYQAGHCTFDLETTSADPLRAEVVGFSFSWKKGEACYVPIAAPKSSEEAYRTLRLQDAAGEAPDVRPGLKKMLEDVKVSKNGQNAKYDILVLSQYGIEVRGLVFDTMVASYLLNPGNRQHNLDLLALEYLNIKKIPTEALIGKGKNQITMRDVPVEEVARYACEDADVTERLRLLFEPRLREAGLWPLMSEVEIPLVEVLSHVERNGVKLDVDFLSAMSAEMAKRLQQLEQEIYELAGETFNINSTQQLGRILFDKLGLKSVRRTKTGYSTDAAVLEKLASVHEMPKKLLEFREISKLKSTYVDALPNLINPRTGRLHTSYNQTVAATGRLSSSDPNLQNIPIRTDIGREIRRAFIPAQPGWKIFDADYSQIELRIMAHLSQDPTLIEAFRADQDIHRATAATVFGVPPAQVTADLRRRAKEINFGIMYGMGAYGLAQRLGISSEEAQEIINAYFIKYPNVNNFMIACIQTARETGYVTTLLKRRRYLPDILSENRRVREFAERTAINTPIQGTAADMIKVAMIRIHHRLVREKLQGKMIMQVHDELVFDVPEAELATMERVVREEMEGALELDVPIKVEIGAGENWLDAH